jgi:hypothetical protein
MDQKTGIRSLYVEFFRGYEAEIGLSCPAFRPNSAYKRTCTLSAFGWPVLLVMAGEPTMTERPNDENSEFIPWACHSTEMS